MVGSAAFFNPTIDPYFRNDDGSIDYTTTNGYWNYGSGRGEDFTPNTLLGAGPLLAALRPRQYGACQAFHRQRQIDYKVHGFEALRFNLNLGLDVSSAKTYDGVNPRLVPGIHRHRGPRLGTVFVDDELPPQPAARILRQLQ